MSSIPVTKMCNDILRLTKHCAVLIQMHIDTVYKPLTNAVTRDGRSFLPPGVASIYIP